MKPTTKFQKLIVNVDTTLEPISKEQSDYFYKECLFHKAVALKSGKTTCLDCSHSWNITSTIGWNSESKKGCCPNCGTKITIEHTRKKRYFDFSYGQIIQTHKGFQVIRAFTVNGSYNAGKKPYLSIREVSRIYLSADGKFEIIGNYNQWSFSSEAWVGEFSLKDRSTINRGHNMLAHKVYPKIKVLKELKRNGFKGGFHNKSVLTLFKALLTNSYVETLFKAKQYSFLKSIYLDGGGDIDSSKIEKRWDSIKICMRNNYKVKDTSLWFDYLDFLEFFGKDLRNPKYVCPTDLKMMHDFYLHEKREFPEKERVRKLKEKRKQSILVCADMNYSIIDTDLWFKYLDMLDYIGKDITDPKYICPSDLITEFENSVIIYNRLKVEENQRQYEMDKGKFFDLQILSNDYLITVLKSIDEFIEESTELAHCIYESEYFKRVDSLILSAKYKGVRVETIEIDLNQFEIQQCRGFDNLPSDHNMNVINIITNNLPLIREIQFNEMDKVA